MIISSKISKIEILNQLDKLNVNKADYPLIIVGLRGYEKGLNQRNDRNVYDDAIGILTDDDFILWRGNTDPSRSGFNKKVGKGFASLKVGFYPSYKFDVHNGSKPHEAICQRVASVLVIRDGGKEERGMFGINIHKGGFKTTSSDGCQTLHPNEWEEFYDNAKHEAQRLWGDDWKSKTVGYLLMEL